MSWARLVPPRTIAREVERSLEEHPMIALTRNSLYVLALAFLVLPLASAHVFFANTR